MKLRLSRIALAALSLSMLCGLSALAQGDPRGATDPRRPSAQTIEHGRYMVLLGHCNNCHTAGYAPAEGKVPEAQWLLGNPVGWRSRMGTTYAVNLRLYMQNLSEEGWLQAAHTIRSRPPMPWWSLRDMRDDDLKAVYHYIRSLAPAGQPAPAFLPPDQTPQPPYNQLPDMSLGR